MKRYVISAMLVLIGFIIVAFAFVANDQYVELFTTRGATQRSMRALKVVSNDLRAEASTVGVNPARFHKSIQLRILLIGAAGITVMASGLGASIVFRKGHHLQCS